MSTDSTPGGPLEEGGADESFTEGDAQMRGPLFSRVHLGVVFALAIGGGAVGGALTTPKDGVLLTLGVLIAGLAFAFLAKPPPLRRHPGRGGAVDFGRSPPPREDEPPADDTPAEPPNRASRRKAARDERRAAGKARAAAANAPSAPSRR